MVELLDDTEWIHSLQLHWDGAKCQAYVNNIVVCIDDRFSEILSSALEEFLCCLNKFLARIPSRVAHLKSSLKR